MALFTAQTDQPGVQVDGAGAGAGAGIAVTITAEGCVLQLIDALFIQWSTSGFKVLWRMTYAFVRMTYAFVGV